MPKKLTNAVRLGLLASVLLLAPSLPAQELPNLGESSFAEMPTHMERRIGEAVLQELLRDPTYLDDPEVRDYLAALGAKLVAADPGARFDFEFLPLQDPTINAFAVPGGVVGVHTGLILEAQSEAELAGVLAHEVSHVTQRHIPRMMAKQKQATMGMLAAMALALAASRGNGQLAAGALTAGQAGMVSSQLAFTRDFEREADRIGFLTLERAGFDVNGMSGFFERLQAASRLYENNAPAYLRTHPLTIERLSDMQNRAQSRPIRPHSDSPEFHLVRAKLRAMKGTANESVRDFSDILAQKKYSNEYAAHYGMARAWTRAKNAGAAEKEVEYLRRSKVASPMIDTLAADVKLAAGDRAGALALLRDASRRFPGNRAIAYALAETQIAEKQPQEAIRTTDAALATYSRDPRLYEMQAKSYAMLGKRASQHRALAEVFAEKGMLIEAVHQLESAQRAGDGDYYENSRIDARLRELKAKVEEQRREKAAGGGLP